MGIDGLNTLQIRGPEEMLDEMSCTGLVLSGEDLQGNESCEYIAEHYFGSHLEILLHDKNYLVVKYYYRNDVFREYLDALLRKYPKCWFKNRYTTETGVSGLWIGRMQGGQPYIQECEWNELTIEEITFVTDFSRPSEMSIGT